jgi:hypothetical protein
MLLLIRPRAVTVKRRPKRALRFVSPGLSYGRLRMLGGVVVPCREHDRAAASDTARTGTADRPA